MKKLLVFLQILLVISPIVANAKEVDVSQLSYLQQLEEKKFQSLSDLSYNELTDENLDKEHAVSTSQIFKTITFFDSQGNVLSSENFKVSDEEYEKKSVVPGEMEYVNFVKGTVGLNSTVSKEANYRKLTLTIIPYGSSVNNKKIEVVNEWLTMPSVKEQDILAVRFTNSTPQAISNVTFTAKQIYNNGLEYTYEYNSANRIHKDNGEAIVMNLINSATSMKNTMTYQMAGQNTNLVFYATYQHATDSSIKSEEAKTADLGASAGSGKKLLGNVIILENSIAQKYDGAAGVSVQYDPYDFGF